jgi:hypothetical protein
LPAIRSFFKRNTSPPHSYSHTPDPQTSPSLNSRPEHLYHLL